MKKLKRTEILYFLAAIMLVFGFLAWPSSKKVDQAKAKLDSTNVAINKYRKLAANVDLVDSNFDLQNAEQKAQQRITEGVSLALGGIHSQQDFEQNKSKLEADLGSRLANELVDYSKDHNTNQYISAKNNNVTVAFNKVGNPSHAGINVSTEFERQDGTKKYVLITGDYNLETGKFIDYEVSHLSKQPTTHSTAGGNN